MKLLAWGTYDVRSHPRFGVLLEGFRAHGDVVIEVNRPLKLSTASRVAILQQPWRLPKLVGQLVRCWTVLAWRGWRAGRVHRPDHVVVGYLGHLDVRLARLLFRRHSIVLDHLIFAAETAADRRVDAPWKAAFLRRLDSGALRSADVIVVDTAEHASMVPPEFADRAVVVPVGASEQWFRAGAQARSAGPAHDAPVRVVFFGLFTPLQGAPTIGKALSELGVRDDIRVTMIGTGQDLAETQQAVGSTPQVDWVPWVPAEELPDLVARHDVCLGIVGTSGKAHRVVPNKVFQGAAAGCAIVTGDTTAQRRMLGDAAAFVPVGDPQALAATLGRLASDRAELTELKAAATDRAATTFTPKVIITDLRQALVRLADSADQRLPRRRHVRSGVSNACVEPADVHRRIPVRPGQPETRQVPPAENP
jgi:glycosyltransferase involved in cell wall biosynthesis